MNAEMLRYWVAGTLITVGPVLALASLELAWVRALPGWVMRALRRPPPLLFAAFVMMVMAALSVWMSRYITDFAPATAEEVARLWHSRILMAGRLTLAADPHWAFFAADTVITRGGGTLYNPAGPAVQVLGNWMHAPGLLNPLLGGLTAAALYQFARRAYGESQARAAAALFLATPMALLQSASYLNDVPVLLLVVTTLMLVAEWDRATRTRWRALSAVGVGFTVGAAIAIQPQAGVVIAVVATVFQCAQLRGDRARAWELAVEFAAGALALAPLLYVSAKSTGHVFQFLNMSWPATAAASSALVAGRLAGLNRVAADWTLPGLLVALVGVASLRRVTRWDALLFALFGAQVVVAAIVPGETSVLGPRTLYLALPVLVVFLARTPFLVAGKRGGYWRHAAPLALLTLVAVTWLLPMPPYGARGLVRAVRHAHAPFYPDLASAAQTAGARHAVVFVHQPFGARLMRRMRALGFPDSTAADLLRRSDACSLLGAIVFGESDTTLTPAMIAARASTYAPGPSPVQALDTTIRISSTASLTPVCRRELALDARFGPIPFDLGLVLNAVQPDGQPGGDLIYVADLGEHNEALRARYGDRTWYRAWSVTRPDGTRETRVTPY